LSVFQCRNGLDLHRDEAIDPFFIKSDTFGEIRFGCFSDLKEFDFHSKRRTKLGILPSFNIRAPKLHMKQPFKLFVKDSMKGAIDAYFGVIFAHSFQIGS
jgi:hypothetical protein